ncbi:MAG: NRDE family protein [Kiloniellales bacterium]
MCTLVILRRPGHRWPLMLAANRDEMGDRPWRPPGRHWLDRAEVVAGMDELAGGSWLGINDYGVVAGVLNRRGSLGPAADRRSRGELVLEALDHGDAREAAEALADLETRSYRSFNLVVADHRDAYWLCHRDDRGYGGIELRPVPPGLSMLTDYDLNDRSSPRIRDYLPQFRAAAAPDPDRDDWRAWQGLLASRVHDAGAGPTGAMNISTRTGFATLSSSLIAVPAADQPAGLKPRWRFAPGHPDEVAYAAVELG